MKVRALLVDDNEDFLASAGRLLESQGIEVIGYARSGAEALQLAAEHEPNLALVDIELGEEDGIALTRELEAHAPAPAVYYVVSEALTNAIRYSSASAISVKVGSRPSGAARALPIEGSTGAESLYATVADDGDGGAEPTLGSGLTGLADRIEALGGRFALQSPPGRGTTIWITLPLTP